MGSMSDSSHGWPWILGKFYALIQRNPASNRALFELADIEPDDRILDVGCGAGGALVLAAEVVGEENVAGADPTSALAGTARRRLPGARIEVAPAEALPFDDASFTMVWTIASHHHWRDSRSGLAEIFRVLEPGGRLLLAEHRMKRDGGHGLSEKEAEDLRLVLEELGFEDANIIRHGKGRRALLVLSGHRPVA